MPKEQDLSANIEGVDLEKRAKAVSQKREVAGEQTAEKKSSQDKRVTALSELFASDQDSELPQRAEEESLLLELSASETRDIISGKFPLQHCHHYYAPRFSHNEDGSTTYRYLRVCEQQSLNDPDSGLQLVIRFIERTTDSKWCPPMVGYANSDGSITYGSSRHQSWLDDQVKDKKMFYFADKFSARALADPCGVCLLHPTKPSSLPEWLVYQKVKQRYGLSPRIPPRAFAREVLRPHQEERGDLLDRSVLLDNARQFGGDLEVAAIYQLSELEAELSASELRGVQNQPPLLSDEQRAKPELSQSELAAHLEEIAQEVDPALGLLLQAAMSAEFESKAELDHYLTAAVRAFVQEEPIFYQRRLLAAYVEQFRSNRQGLFNQFEQKLLQLVELAESAAESTELDLESQGQKSLSPQLEAMDLPTRIIAALQQADIETTQDLILLTEEELRSVEDIGDKSANTIKVALEENDLHLKQELDENELASLVNARWLEIEAWLTQASPERVAGLQQMYQRVIQPALENQRLGQFAKKPLREMIADQFLVTQPETMIAQAEEVLMALGFSQEQLAPFAAALYAQQSIPNFQEQLSLDENSEFVGLLARECEALFAGLTLAEDGAEQVDAFYRAAQLVVPLAKYFDEQQLESLDQSIRQAVAYLPKVNRTQAAHGLVIWANGLQENKKRLAIETGDQSNIQELVQSPRLLRSLIPLLEPIDFDQVGLLIKSGLESEGQATLLSDLLAKYGADLTPELMSWPDELVRAVTNCFLEAGYLSETKTGKIRLTAKGKERPLNFQILRNAVLSVDLLLDPFEDAELEEPSLDFDQVVAKQERKRADLRTPEIVVKTDREVPKILHLAELHLGHKDSAVAYVRQFLDYLASLPPEERQDLITVSGLVQGTFAYREKNRRPTLVIDDLGEQFAAARSLMEEIDHLDIDIIYNLSDEDIEVCRDLTIDVLSMLVDCSKSKRNPGKAGKHVPYWKVDQFRQSPAWDHHNQFITRVVFPFCLRAGRDLLDEEEMLAVMGRRQHEYFMLYEAYHNLQEGKAIDPEYHEFLENTEQATLNGKPVFKGKSEYQYINGIGAQIPLNQYPIVDGLRLRVDTPNDSYLIRGFHNFRFSSKPRYQKPTSKLEAMIRQMQANQEELPDLFFIQHQNIFYGKQLGDTWMVSLQGLKEADVNQRESVLEVSGDPTWRQWTTRAYQFKPDIASLGWTEDKRFLVEPHLKAYLDKMHESPERQVVMVWADWQVGSPTARMDFQVKQINRLAQLLKQGYEVNLYIIGDIIQGSNYRNFKQESRRMKAISLAEQKGGVEFMILEGLSHLSAEELGNLNMVRIAPGNHEMNSGHSWLGESHSHYLETTFMNLLYQQGVPYDEDLIKLCLLTRQTRGDHFNFSVIKEEIAGYGVRGQHQITGSRSGDPAYNFIKSLSGLGPMFIGDDLVVAGHNHGNRFVQVGDMMVVITGSLAGTSGFDYYISRMPEIGSVEFYLGGGKPPQIGFSSFETYAQAEIEEGKFAPEYLADVHGLTDDPGFDPYRHGFAQFEDWPQSALQQRLWDIIEKQNWAHSSTLVGE